MDWILLSIFNQYSALFGPLRLRSLHQSQWNNKTLIPSRVSAAQPCSGRLFNLPAFGIGPCP